MTAFLRRLLTSWVTDDPAPAYSRLDRADGLGEPLEGRARMRRLNLVLGVIFGAGCVALVLIGVL